MRKVSEKIKRMVKLVNYDERTGHFYSVKTNARLIPDDDGCLSVYDPDTKRTAKVKAFYVVENKVYGMSLMPELFGWLHRNMDTSDYRLQNLWSGPKREIKLIKEAYDNIMGKLKLSHHPTDKYSFVLEWMENGVKRRKVYYDSIPANRRKARLMLEYSKIATSVLNFEES